MKLKLIIYRSLQENANAYYEKAKKAREKIARLEKEIEKTKKELETPGSCEFSPVGENGTLHVLSRRIDSMVPHAQKRIRLSRQAAQSAKPKTLDSKLKTERNWFEKFHWFLTSGGKLVIGGRNAKQNELILSKYMTDRDLLFHAEVQSPMTVLKEGMGATPWEKAETAQFCASYSRAWRMGYPTMNVYCARKEQLVSAVSGEYLAHGAVAITGTKEWFKNVKLGLRIGMLDGKMVACPIDSAAKIEHAVQLLPGQKKKASEIAKKLGVTKDKVDPLMPGEG